MKNFKRICITILTIMMAASCQLIFEYPNEACGYTYTGTDECFGNCEAYVGPDGYMTFSSELTGTLECSYFTPEENRISISRQFTHAGINYELIEAFSSNRQLHLKWRLVDPCADVETITMSRMTHKNN